MKFYAEKFKRIRQLKKISMQNVTDIANISRVSLWTWEKGKRIPSEANIRALARAINTDIAEVSDLKPVKASMIKDFSKPVQSLLEIADFDTVKRDNTMKQLKHQIDMLDNKLNHASTIINALISSLDTAFYIKDTNQRFIIANNSFLKMLKINANMIITGKRDIDLFPAKEAKINNALDINVISTGKPITGVENFIPGTRKQKWGLTSRIPISERAGKIIGIICIFVDITERKHLESELDNSHEKLEYLVTKRTADLQNKTHDLKELVKELNCLYEISNLIDTPNITLSEIYQRVIDLIPSWLYPEKTSARLSINDKKYLTAKFSESRWKMDSPVNINNKKVGTLEVFCTKEMSPTDIRPFLKEERTLLNVIAERLGRIASRVMTEKALTKSEEKYRSFLENLGDIAYETDINGNITYCNKFTEEATGLSLKDIINKPFLPLYTDESQKIVSDVYPRTLKGERTIFELTFKNGRIFQYKQEQILDKNGNVIGVFGIGRDITESKKIENELRISRNLEKVIFDSLPHPAMIINHKRKIIAANKIALEFGAQLHGYCWKEFGKTEYISEEDKLRHHKGDVDGIKCTFCLADEAIDMHTITKNPELRAFGKIWDIYWKYIGMGDNGDKLYLHYAMDITKSNNMINALKKSEDKFRLIFDNAIEGMALVEPESKKFVLANKAFCKMMGYKKNDIKKFNIFDVHPSEDIPYIMEQFRKHAEGELSITNNLRMKKKNGNIIYVDISAGTVDLNEKSYMLGIFRNSQKK